MEIVIEPLFIRFRDSLKIAMLQYIKNFHQEEFIMRTKRKIVLFTAVCMLNVLLAGCSFHSAPDVKTANQTDEASSEAFNNTLPANDNKKAENTENAVSMENPQENTEGKWHVLDSETAAAVDADFIGTIWHIAEGAFSIAETQIQLLDDGSLVGSGLSSNANIPDSQLIHVVVDDDTYFYTRTFSGNGDSYEDTEAGFGDLKEHMSVEMKGSFENDVFYASEIRIIKIS